MHPLLGPLPATQACALTGNQTDDPLVHRPALNPLSYTSQGCLSFLNGVRGKQNYDPSRDTYVLIPRNCK